MTKTIPAIKKYMTTTPHTVGSEQTLLHAKQLMQELAIRHLPVLSGGKITGIISDRDISFMQTIKGVDLKTERVQQAMTIDPVTVPALTPLDEICREMASKKIGSVLVEDNHKLVGIFTWVDALNAMDELLKTRLAK